MNEIQPKVDWYDYIVSKNILRKMVRIFCIWGREPLPTSPFVKGRSKKLLGTGFVGLRFNERVMRMGMR